DMNLEFHVEGRIFTVQVVGARAITRDGAARDPEAVIEADVRTLIELRRSRLDPGEALRTGRAKITSGGKPAGHRFGDVFAWRNLPRLAPMPIPESRSSRSARAR